MIERDWEDDDESAFADDASRLEASEMLRRMRWYQQQLEEVVAPFQAEIDRLRARVEEVSRPIQHRIDWYQGGLENWHRAAFAEKKATPTVKLPYGDILLRRATPKIEVVDEAEVLAWAAGEGHDVLPDPRVMVSKLNKVAKVVDDDSDEPGTPLPVIDKEGEVVPGVTSEARERTFSVSKPLTIEESS